MAAALEQRKDQERTKMAAAAAATSQQLRGYLKSAEARERLQERQALHRNRQEEDDTELVRFQQTAMEAIRLEAYLTRFTVSQPRFPYGKTEAQRIERLLSDRH